MSLSGYFGDKSSDIHKQHIPASQAVLDSSQPFNCMSLSTSNILPNSLISVEMNDSYSNLPNHDASNQRFEFSLNRTMKFDNTDHTVYCIDHASDKIVVGLKNHKIIVWDTNFQQFSELKGHEGSVYCVKIVADLIYSGSKDRSIKVWNIETGDCVKTLSGHLNSITSLAIHGDSMVSCSSSDSNSNPKKQAQILCWNIPNLNFPVGDLVEIAYETKILQDRQSFFECYVVDCDDNYIIAHLSTKLFVFNKQTGLINLIDSNENAEVTCLKLSTSHNLVICGYKNGAIILWDLKTFNRIKKNTLHNKPIICIKCDEEFLVTGSHNLLNVFNFVAFKDLQSDPIVQHFKYDSNNILYTFYFDKKKILTGLNKSNVEIYLPSRLC